MTIDQKTTAAVDAYHAAFCRWVRGEDNLGEVNRLGVEAGKLSAELARIQLAAVRD